MIIMQVWLCPAFGCALDLIFLCSVGKNPRGAHGRRPVKTDQRDALLEGEVANSWEFSDPHYRYRRVSIAGPAENNLFPAGLL